MRLWLSVNGRLDCALNRQLLIDDHRRKWRALLRFSWGFRGVVV